MFGSIDFSIMDANLTLNIHDGKYSSKYFYLTVSLIRTSSIQLTNNSLTLLLTMTSIRYSLIFLFAAVFAVATATTNYSKGGSCCIKAEKCCQYLEKCGYATKSIKVRKPIKSNVCKKECKNVPQKTTKKVCKNKRVVVPCKYNGSKHVKTSHRFLTLDTAVRDGHSDDDSDSGSDSGKETTKPDKPKVCYANKPYCVNKTLTTYKKVCANKCKVVTSHKVVAKILKFQKYCVKTRCKKIPTKCTGKKLVGHVSKKPV